MRNINPAIYAVIENANDFGRNPETNTSADWALVLVSEFGEWANAVQGKHEDRPAYELVQMGGIILNMLSQYSEPEIYAALDAIRARHVKARP